MFHPSENYPKNKVPSNQNSDNKIVLHQEDQKESIKRTLNAAIMQNHQRAQQLQSNINKGQSSGGVRSGGKMSAYEQAMKGAGQAEMAKPSGKHLRSSAVVQRRKK